VADDLQSYVMVLPVPMRRIDEHRFAAEGSFVSHLMLLREKLGELGRRMVIVSPELSAEHYERMKSGLAVVDEKEAGIRFRPAFPAFIGNLTYARHAPKVLAILREEIANASIVHSGGSPLYQPFEIAALVIARAMGKKTIFVTDIDQRESARMNYKTGRWNARQYWTNKLLHIPYYNAMHMFAARAFSLVLLKGGDLARDFGEGRPHVHDFLDSAFSEKHIIGDERMSAKLAVARDPAQPLKLVYFGRLTAYKGIDHMLRALRKALDRGAAPVELHLIGGGEQQAELEALVKELQLQAHVLFRGVIPFGEQLFDALYDLHVLLAAPLSEDTPRSALDAMASGLSLIAYDTYYYRDLAAMTDSVALVPWLDQEALASAIVTLAHDRKRLCNMMEQSRTASFANTQEIWLDRRVEWTRALVG